MRVPHPRSGQEEYPILLMGDPQPHPRSGQGYPHPRSGQGYPHPRSGQGSPHPRSGQGSPHPRSGQGSPHPRSGLGGVTHPSIQGLPIPSQDRERVTPLDGVSPLSRTQVRTGEYPILLMEAVYPYPRGCSLILSWDGGTPYPIGRMEVRMVGGVPPTRTA